MASEPLYPTVKPKILLLNFSAADADALKAKNYNIERGWAAVGAHHFPSPGYEYDVVIARFDKLGLEMSRSLSQYGSSANDDYENLRETIEGAGFALVFTDDSSRTALHAAGIVDVRTIALDERDTNYVIASDAKDHPIQGYNFSLGILRRERGNLVRPVQTGLSWSHDEKNPIFSLAQNAAEHSIAAMGVLRKEQWNPQRTAYDYSYSIRYVVLPAVKDTYARIAADFLSQLPSWRPELFPSDSNYSWLESEAYWSAEMFKTRDQLESTRTDFTEKISAQEAAYSTVRLEDQLVRQLIVADDSDEFPEGLKLTDAVLAAFGFLGFEVEHRDREVREGKRREDLVCKDGEYEALVECKGTVSQNPQEAYASQLLNHLLAAKSNGEPRGILVINHDRKRDALSRSLPYEDAPHILEYDIAIVPTVELFKLIRAVQNGEKTTEEARALLKTRGRFQYPLPEASPGSTAESGK